RLGCECRRRVSRRLGCLFRSFLGRRLSVTVLEVIKTLVGETDQRVTLVPVLGIGRDTVVHAHADGQIERAQQFGKHDTNTTAQSRSLGRVGLRKNQRELVAAGAKSRVGSTQGLAQGCGRRVKDFVATRVAVLVVYLLETVQIKGNQAQRMSITARAVEFLVEGFIEDAAVVQAGERIGDGTAL